MVAAAIKCDTRFQLLINTSPHFHSKIREKREQNGL